MANFSSADEVIIVGRLGAPHGVRGEVHIHSYTTPAENLLTYQPWLFRRRPLGRNANKRSYVSAADQEGGQKGGDQWYSLEVSELRSHQDHYLGRISGFAEREQVAELKGLQIGVPRRQLPDPDDDEFYWRDLIGAQVIDQADRVLGQVAGLLETGVHDVLRVRPEASGAGEILIPFVKAYVLSVSREQIRVDWDPQWLS